MLTAAQYAEINLLSVVGLSNREICRATHRDRETIRKVLRLKTPPPPAPRIRQKKLDPFRKEVEQRLTIGSIHHDQLLLKPGNPLVPPGPPAKPANLTPDSTGDTATAGETNEAEAAVDQALAAARANVSLCEPWRLQIEAGLDQQVSAKRIHQDLVHEHGFAGSYQSVKRYVRKLELQVPVGYHGSLRTLQKFIRPFQDKQLKRRRTTATVHCGASLLARDHSWMLRLMQGDIDAVALESVCSPLLTPGDARLLMEKILTGRLGIRNRAVAVAAHFSGIPARSIAPFLKLDRHTVHEYCRHAYNGGVHEFFDLSRKEIKKADDPCYRDAVFKILHAPPSSFGINRTTWKMSDIRSVLSKQGLPTSAATVRLIIRKAGFRFRKARKALTSTDPDYREKLQGITAILQSLKPDEKFFSIDEFGPFAIKLQGGRSLVKAGEIRTVPQHQRSKGRLICTAALELSENQVTHFYSEKKNTGEMLKLLDALLVAYANQSCIYFSWDAASWHASKKLYRRVAEINSDAYRASHPGPRVTLAPLPACAQFLNVIESVFSGMARAIIHNSDYPSPAVCMEAIDRYFVERNTYFREHPKRAGNKLWGKERVPATFDEAHNCKDPRWR